MDQEYFEQFKPDFDVDSKLEQDYSFDHHATEIMGPTRRNNILKGYYGNKKEAFF